MMNLFSVTPHIVLIFEEFHTPQKWKLTVLEFTRINRKE